MYAYKITIKVLHEVLRNKHEKIDLNIMRIHFTIKALLLLILYTSFVIVNPTLYNKHGVHFNKNILDHSVNIPCYVGTIFQTSMFKAFEFNDS